VAKKEKRVSAAKDAPEGGAEKPRGSRKMLLAAALMCVLSLGGGFFLARTAYLQEVESLVEEVDSDHAVADESGADAHGNDADTHTKKSNLVEDPLAKDGHPAENAMALQEKPKGGDGSEAVDDGLLDIGDFVTNIQEFDSEGKAVRVFLKISMVVAYRTEPGAQALMTEREPFMRDVFNGYLRGLSESDVRGMAGILQVKSELLKRARAAVGNDLPQEILIRDLIVQ
jgi:hypothetical protein